MSDEKFYAMCWTIGICVLLICLTAIDIVEAL